MLRRIWWLGIAWAGLALLTSTTTFVSWVVMPMGGLKVYLALPYWWADFHRPAAALVMLAACVVWCRSDLVRRSRPAAGMALVAACLLLVPLVLMWNNPMFTGTAPPPARMLLWQAIACVEMAVVPLAMLWAAAGPARFGLSRLAGLAAVALALAAANDTQVIIGLHERLHYRSGAFWDALLSRAYLGIGLTILIEAAAAALFAVAAFRFPRGQGMRLAMTGSWLLVGLAILLQTTVYGIWWDAWQLSVPQHMLRHLDNLGAMLLSYLIGLAFLLPICDSERRTTVES